MDGRDLRGVLAIQAESPEIAQWAPSDYDFRNRPGTCGWVAERDGEIVGFLVARLVSDELEILNLAVRADSRRQGAGRLLLQEALAWAVAQGAKKAYLEVRASNEAALRFYQRQGFEQLSRRSGYYSLPLEDALILSLELAKT